MGLRSIAFVVLLASLVGACALTDPVDTRYDMIGRSLAKARNEAIFLNLVRASHDYPLAFTAISQVTPSMTNTSSLALPSFLEGPGAIVRSGAGGASTISTFPSSSPFRDVIFGNTTASDSTVVSSNFNVATQETSTFYLGFLKPIDLQTLDYFIRQGYSRELLFWLFADNVEVTAYGHTVGMRYDPPNDYGCDPKALKQLCFADFMLTATGAGLTVEELTLESASSAGKGAGGTASKDSSGGGAKTETTIFARFCFDPVLAQQARSRLGERQLAIAKTFNTALAGPICGTHWDPVQQAKTPQADTMNFSVGPYNFKISPRSAYGVFEFLGTLIKMQRDKPERLPTAYVPQNRLDEITQLPTLYTVADDQNIITVVRENSPDCFSHTWFRDGEYCVPESASNSKRIFGLLAQLIAIETAASDLSITPIVRVIQ
jgi:hypothetical protein